MHAHEPEKFLEAAAAKNRGGNEQVRARAVAESERRQRELDTEKARAVSWDSCFRQ